MAQQFPTFKKSLNSIWKLLPSQQKKALYPILFLAITTAVLEVVTASVTILLAQLLIDPVGSTEYLNKKLFAGAYSSSFIMLLVASGVGIAFTVKNFVVGFELLYQNSKISGLAHEFRVMMLRRYANVPYAFHITRNSAYGLSVIGSDIDLTFAGVSALIVLTTELFVFITLSLLLLVVQPNLTLSLMIVALIMYFVSTKLIMPIFYHWGKNLQEHSLGASKHLLQFLNGFKEIVLFNKKEYFVNAYAHHSAEKASISAKIASVNMMPRIIVEWIFVTLFVTVIGIFSLLYIEKSNILATLSVYFYAGFRLMPGINKILSQFSVFKSSIPSIERLLLEVNTPETFVRDSLAMKKSALGNRQEELDFSRDIVCENLSFTYPGAKKPSLTDVNLQIKVGDTVGVVGESGSGKSTLIDLLVGLLEPTKGSITIDSKYPASTHSWRREIGYVSQNIYLTDESIAENIAFGEDVIDPDKLASAISDAQLDKLLSSLPSGVDTIVGERGVRLSGGERQRISIARALYHRPKVLILDEATSALDSKTESDIMNTIRPLMGNLTVIMVSHRISTLINCNRIVKVMDGKCTEEENLASLAKKSKN